MDQSTFVPARPADLSPVRCSQSRKFHGNSRRLDGIEAVRKFARSATHKNGEPGAPPGRDAFKAIGEPTESEYPHRTQNHVENLCGRQPDPDSLPNARAPQIAQ